MNYSQLEKTFQRIIKRYDQRSIPISLTLRRNGSIDPADGSFVQGSTSTTNLKGVVINYTDQQADGTLIKRGDLKLVITSYIKPNIGDTVIIDGSEYSVLEPITTFNPGGVVLGYEMQVRR
jgi:hypothetical protein